MIKRKQENQGFMKKGGYRRRTIKAPTKPEEGAKENIYSGYEGNADVTNVLNTYCKKSPRMLATMIP
jgi:hypothetical protein